MTHAKRLAFAAFVLGLIAISGCVPRERQLEDELTAAQVTIAAQQKKIEAQTAQINELSQAKSTFADTVLEIEKALEHLGAQLPIANVLNDQIDGRLALTSEREGLKEMVAQLESIQQQLADEAADAKEKLANAEERLAHADAVSKELYGGRLNALSQTLSLVADENARLRADVQKYQTRLVEAQEQIDGLTQRAQDADDARQKAEDDAAKAKAAEAIAAQELLTGSRVIAPRAALLRMGVLKKPRFSRDYTARCSACGCEPTSLYGVADPHFTIPAPIEKVRVYSEHPADSWYTKPDGRGESVLVITDPSRFWKHSKCLVVGY